MNVCLSVFISINYLTVLSSIAIAGGLYLLFVGFQLLARKRLLLNTPTSRIRSAALGLVEVTGAAAGPYTISAPITGKPCFLYHTTAWRLREGKKREWEKVADETLHLPFFIDDSTGQLLVEPLGADLDLHRDVHEEYTASFLSSNFANVPPRVSVFLSRHGVVPGRHLRIEERSIKPEDALFIAGTLTENPGVQVRPFSLLGPALANQLPHCTSCNPLHGDFSQRLPAPQIIRLASGEAPSTIQEMGQQAKIAAALARAGITKPAAWSAAGVPYQTVAVEENEPPATGSANAQPCVPNATLPEERLSEHPAKSSDFNFTPPVVLMKGANNPTFVISFRSQKEFVTALAWKSTALVWGGAGITLLGLYMLLAQMELL